MNYNPLPEDELFQQFKASRQMPPTSFTNLVMANLPASAPLSAAVKKPIFRKSAWFALATGLCLILAYLIYYAYTTTGYQTNNQYIDLITIKVGDLIKYITGSINIIYTTIAVISFAALLLLDKLLKKHFLNSGF